MTAFDITVTEDAENEIVYIEVPGPSGPAGADGGVHTHIEADVTNLVSDLAGKASTASLALKQNKIKTVTNVFTDGGLNPIPNTSSAWAFMSPYFLSIPAVVGDEIEAAASFLSIQAATAFLDLAVLNGSAIVRFLSTGTATPSDEGYVGWYANQPANFRPVSMPLGLIVAGGDIFGGNVKIGLVANSTGTGRLYAQAGYPFTMRVRNLGNTS